MGTNAESGRHRITAGRGIRVGVSQITIRPSPKREDLLVGAAMLGGCACLMPFARGETTGGTRACVYLLVRKWCQSPAAPGQRVGGYRSCMSMIISKLRSRFADTLVLDQRKFENMQARPTQGNPASAE